MNVKNGDVRSTKCSYALRARISVSVVVWKVCSRDGMIHRCIAVSQYDTGIDTTFNVSIYRVSQKSNVLT